MTKSLADQPDDATTLWNRARLLNSLRRLDEALADCNRAIELEPGNRHPYFWRGVVRLSLNRHEQSLADFRFSYAQRPEDDWCLRHIAWILLGGPPELRDTQEALRLAEEAERIARERKRDNQPLCLAAIGMARYRLGEFDAALAALDKAIKSGAANARTLLFAAMCHHQLGDRESARLYYAEALHRIERQTRDDGLGDPKYVRAEAEEFLEVAQ